MEKTIASNRILKKAISNFGFNDVNEFAIQYLKMLILSKIEEYKSAVQFYERKYQMNFYDFQKNYLNSENYEDFAKEDDALDWEFNIECLHNYIKDLEELENAESVFT